MRYSYVLVVASVIGTGCGDSEAEIAPAPLCTAPSPLVCEDQAFQVLQLNDLDVSTGAIVNAEEAGGFRTNIDASAGGFNAQPQGAYVYGRFTATGLERVPISDEASLTDMDWEIAFQRFRIRLNSGSAGPSCVSGARLPATVDYAAVEGVPATTEFFTESFFTPTCDPITDGGLGAPQLVLGSFYDYVTCLKMNGNVYAIQLADGRRVKLRVNRYYDADAQRACNSDSPSFVPSGSANFEIVWAFID